MALGKRHRHRRQASEIPPAFAPRRERSEQPTAGPWDIDHVPDDGVERVDLGALHVPQVAGFELRVEVNQEGQILSATLASSRGEMQLGAFAAPRSAGIWDSVRAELLATVRNGGGSLQEQDGPFGAELVGRVPSGKGLAPARFVGVDGPRWFLRALLVGPVATDADAAKPLEDALRHVVVDRGGDPLPVREPLPLQLPKSVADQIAAEKAAAEQAAADGPDRSAHNGQVTS